MPGKVTPSCLSILSISVFGIGILRCSMSSSLELEGRTPGHHPGRVVNDCTDQARMFEPFVCMPLFRLFLSQRCQCHDYEPC